MQLNNYNFVAKYYDFISGIVYGNKLNKIQATHLSLIPAKSRILIIGGGTGKILESIQNEIGHTSPTVVFLDASSEMIKKASQRNYGNLTVHFVVERLENYVAAQPFDVILTPFFFDNFTAEKINFLFPKTEQLIRKNGLWIYTDFNIFGKENKLLNRLTVKTMYLFFKIFSQIETAALVDMQPYFQHYNILAKQAGFVQSIAYQKP